MDIDYKVACSAAKALLKLYSSNISVDSIQVQETKREFEGDITVVVFPFLKMSKTSPEITATALGELIAKDLEEVTGFNVVKGFLNLEIANSYWIRE